MYTTKSPGIECDADFYLWDTEQAWNIYSQIETEQRSRHCFLFGLDDIPRFKRTPEWKKTNILLKPVTKAALAAVLSNACNTTGVHSPHSDKRGVESLRADREELLQTLIQTNLKLQEYDHDRTRFLARAIHDFRAPLTALTGYCGLLLGEDVGPVSEQQREILERMQRSAKRLSRMASGMFQLSIEPRVEIPLDARKDDIKHCLDQALYEILPAVTEKGIVIDMELSSPPEALRFDATKIEQVLINLLDNASKFTPRSGLIRIKAYPFFWERRVCSRPSPDGTSDRRVSREIRPNSYRIDIRDSGPGIPGGHLLKIFEEYTSYAGGTDRSGGGLGLAICRMIVQQHRGTIWAESSGEGAVFSFVLPLDTSEIETRTSAHYRSAG